LSKTSIACLNNSCPVWEKTSDKKSRKTEERQSVSKRFFILLGFD